MECTDPRLSEKLLPFIDGQLPDDERARLASHVRECRACRAEVELLSPVTASIRSAAAGKRGPCPSADDLIAAVEDDAALPAGRADAIHEHILSCASCREEALILEELRARASGAVPVSDVAMPAPLVHAFRAAFSPPREAGGGFLEALGRFFTANRPFAFGGVVVLLLICLTIVLLPKIIHQAGISEGTAQISPVAPSDAPALQPLSTRAVEEIPAGREKLAALDKNDGKAETPATPEPEKSKAETPASSPASSPAESPSAAPGSPTPAAEPSKAETPKTDAPAPRTEIAVLPTAIPERKDAERTPAPRPSRIEEPAAPPLSAAAPGRAAKASAPQPPHPAPASGYAAGPSGSTTPAGAPVHYAAPPPAEAGSGAVRDRKVAEEPAPMAAKKVSIASSMGEKSVSKTEQDVTGAEGGKGYGLKEAPGGAGYAQENSAVPAATASSAREPILPLAPSVQGGSADQQAARPAAQALPAPASGAPGSLDDLARRARSAAAAVTGSGAIQSVTVTRRGVNSLTVVVTLSSSLGPGQSQAIRSAVRSALGAPRARVIVNSR